MAGLGTLIDPLQALKPPGTMRTTPTQAPAAWNNTISNPKDVLGGGKPKPTDPVKPTDPTKPKPIKTPPPGYVTAGTVTKQATPAAPGLGIGLTGAPRSPVLSERIAEIAATDSPLMRAAANQGMAAANRRGLVNSSMAAGAAQQAVLDAATPIAGQETQQRFAEQQAGMDRDLQQRMASWQLASSDRNAAAQLMSNMESLFSNDYQSIMSNTNLTAEQRTALIKDLRTRMSKRFSFVEQFYQYDLKW